MHDLEEKEFTVFSKKELECTKDLFEQRSALFFTPTANVPSKYVGKGNFQVSIPIAIPNYIDIFSVKAYRSPKLWVHLIQDQLGIIRWETIFPARVEITAYNQNQLTASEMSLGAKALLDALKVGTYGRSDGRRLHYLGVIQDDSTECIELEYRLELMAFPKFPHTEIRVVHISKIADSSFAIFDNR